jgi:hypothetical protein
MATAPLLHHVKAGPRRFLLKELRVRFTRCVVDHHHEHDAPSPPFKPVVMRAIHLHHLSKTSFALTPSPMLLPSTPHRPLAFFQQPSPQGLVIHFEALGAQLLSRQRRPKIRIPLRVSRQHLPSNLGRCPPPAWAASALVHQARIPSHGIPAPDALGLPITHAHYFRSLHQGEPLSLYLIQNHQAFSFLLTHQ